MMYDEETAVDLYHEEPVEYRKKPLRIAQMTVKKRDIFRMKEELELPQNFPNVSQIIWQSVEPENVEFRALEGKISVQGDLNVFFMYEGEGEEQAVKCYERFFMIQIHRCFLIIHHLRTHLEGNQCLYTQLP